MPGCEITGAVIRYGASAAAVCCACVVTYLLTRFIPQRPDLFPLIGAIVVAAWYCGPGPGWLAVILATIAANYFFIPPVLELDVRAKDIPWLLAFFVTAVVSNAVSLNRRRLESMLVEERMKLEERVRDRTLELQSANQELRDEISERARAQAALREAEGELARAARIATVAELTASIAHEVNQPLTATMANGQAALNWINHDPPNVDETRQSLMAIITAAERAAAIVARIRGLMVRGALSFEEVDINALIKDLVELIRRSLMERDIAVEFCLDPDLPVVRGDRVQLQQLLLNLINNAVDAMRDVVERERKLSLQTRRANDDCIVVVIEDSGGGLRLEDLARMFEPFYSTKRDGMGMGLSLCRTIVSAHGGSIRAVPRAHGAAFEVELPLGMAA